MTLFKRVFHQNADGEPALPILPDTPTPLASVTEVELSLDEELSFDDEQGFGSADGCDPSGEYDLDTDNIPDVSSEPLRLEDPVAFPNEPFAAFEDDALTVEEDASSARVIEAPAGSPPDIESLLMRRVIEKSPRIEVEAEVATEAEAETDAEVKLDATPVAPKPAAATPALTSPIPTPTPERAVSEVNKVQEAEAPTVLPTTPRPGRSARRVRTRMLGFDPGLGDSRDPFEAEAPRDGTPAQSYPVGWMVVVEGPGAGNAFALYNGVSTIGRGVDQTITLDFGDTSISREKHAAVAYDNEQNSFFLGHGGKSNIVRLNERPVLSTEDLNHGDTVRIGETTLRFVALCGAGFAWGRQNHDRT